ncbi:MAG: translation initiation factor IF-2 [Clostridiales bacterium]|jgi:translation initiation factor IF-2|nr:translation initiation factor IF-2 [Clostridiales bacterium]
MSEAAKKPDAIEHIKELKNFEASKLGSLSARIRSVKEGLDQTMSAVREKAADAAKRLEAEKAKTAAEAQKEAEKEAAVRKAERAERERTEKAEKEKAAADAAADAVKKAESEQKAESAKKLADEKKKSEKLAAEKSKPDEAKSDAETPKSDIDASKSDIETPKSNAKTVKSDVETAKTDAEKAQHKTDSKQRAADFLDMQEFGEVRRAENEPPKVAEEKKQEPVSPKPIVSSDPAKRAQAEASMTTSYSSGVRQGYDRNAGGYDRNAGSGGYDRNARPPYQQGQGAPRPPYQGGQGGARPPYQPGQGGPRPPYQGGQGGPRPSGTGGGFRPNGRPPMAAPPILPDASRGVNKEKKKTPFDDKKALTKKALIQKGYVVEDVSVGEDDEVVANKRYKVKRGQKRHEFIQPVAGIEEAVITTLEVPIKVLSEKIGKTAAEIVKKLFLLNMIKTINDNIDFETAELIAGEFGVKLVQKLEQTYEEALENFNIEEELGDDTANEIRPPIVTIMGHVDHGKTSLLDYIRKTQVAEGEAGGITQHIGAYTIELNGKPITFIDTPGHEAFTAMRARGAQVTDIAILVVAADDGVMPQTIEAINHAKAAGVSIIAAINKIDKPAADIARIKQQVSEHGLLPEEWGGDVPMVGVSAKTGEGVQALLENILTLAEVKELTANPKRAARGTIIEAKLDKGRGPVATVLVQNGTLKIADTIVAGTAICRVRAMIDDKGKNIKEAGPSIPVSVLGFDIVPEAGENIFAVADEKLAKQVIGERSVRVKSQKLRASAKMSLEDVYNKISEGLVKDLNLIVKGDVQGSVEALSQALLKISNPEVRVCIIHAAVGAINESDVMLADTSSAVIIGFNVRPDTKAKAAAERAEVDVKMYRIIYDAIEDVEKAIKGMLAPKFKEVVLGQASVRQVFKVTGAGTIAGCMVTSGKITRNAQLRLLRENIVIHEGNVASLKRFKDDAKEVATGFECGIGITDYNDIKENDVIEAFIKEQIEV